jgi:hypothetical protein
MKSWVPPNRVTMVPVLSACAHRGLVDTGMALLKRTGDGEIKAASTVENYGFAWWICSVELGWCTRGVLWWSAECRWRKM